jgi:ribosomal protein S15P/S13E
MARKGMTPSEIGVALRDANGVPSVSSITGTKVLRILRANGLAAAIPEDLYHLVKKAVQVRKHLERNRKDKVRTAPSVMFRSPGTARMHAHTHACMHACMPTSPSPAASLTP